MFGINNTQLQIKDNKKKAKSRTTNIIRWEIFYNAQHTRTIIYQLQTSPHQIVFVPPHEAPMLQSQETNFLRYFIIFNNNERIQVFEYKYQHNLVGDNSIINIIKQAQIYDIIQNQAIYQGFWQNGLPSGECRILYSDNSYYQGKILNGELDTGDDVNQQGLYIFCDGSYYVGNFKRSLFQGKGQFILKNKTMRIYGQFKNGLPHGKCKQKFYSSLHNNQIIQQRYQGDFVEGHKHGKGKYYVAQKPVYQGQFYQGSVHGQGLLFHQNSQKFQGKFQKGNKQEGQLMLINGNIKQKYNQNCKIMEGHGIFQWKDGKFYIGEFKNQHLHGNGAIYFPNGNVLRGEWFQGHNLKINEKIYY